MYAKVSLLGKISQNPEVRYTTIGAMSVSFSVAIPQRATNGDSPKPVLYCVTAWGKLADTLHTIAEDGAIDVGNRVFVAGRLDVTTATDRFGKSHASLSVTADDVIPLGGKRTRQALQELFTGAA